MAEPRKYGDELFNPEQVRRFEAYVDSKYPQFHFRKRRRYAKKVIKHVIKNTIESHIYSGENTWVSSQTLAQRLIKPPRSSAGYLKESIKGLGHSKPVKKSKLLLQKIKGLPYHTPVVIGVKDIHGGSRCIRGSSARIYLLINKLLNALGLSLRLNPSGFIVAVKRLKRKKPLQLEGNCLHCGTPLGKFYDREKPEYHWLCTLPRDDEGVLI